MTTHGPAKTVTARKLVSISLALAIVAAVAVWVRRRPPTSSPVRDEDQMDRCITQMLQAAQDGDVRRYLDCFTDELLAKLAARLEKGNAEAAAAELRSGQAELKSYVTTDWQRVSDDEATLILERVYTNYNERHRVRLRRSRAGWKIAEMTPLESYAPEIPYGTPVFQLPEVGPGEKEPEGANPPTSSPAKPTAPASSNTNTNPAP